MSFFKQMQAEGKIKHIGLSDVTIEQIEKARSVAEIVSVQNHYNIGIRKHEDVVDYCEKNKIIFIPFFPLNSGNITSNISNTLKKIAEKYRVSEYQIALAWLLKRSPVMLPIPGTLSVKHLEENFAALDIELSDEDFETIDFNTIKEV
jgi:aryl-alcohol dehydrogenase-like predicted oxidoreductase